MTRRKAEAARRTATPAEFVEYWIARILATPPLDPPRRLSKAEWAKYRRSARSIAESLWRAKSPEERERWLREGRRRLRAKEAGRER